MGEARSFGSSHDDGSDRAVSGPTDPDAAVALADAVPQALAASVRARDPGTGLDLADRLNAGEVWLTCHLVQTAELPHSGRGTSGHGTDLSTLALHEYQRPKTVTARLVPGAENGTGLRAAPPRPAVTPSARAPPEVPRLVR